MVIRKIETKAKGSVKEDDERIRQCSRYALSAE